MNYNQQREALNLNAPERISEHRLRVLYIATDRLLVAADKIIQTDPNPDPAPQPVAYQQKAVEAQGPSVADQETIVTNTVPSEPDRIAEAQRRLAELYSEAA